MIRSLNNNAVLADVGGKRLILMRKGIGFRRRLGDEITVSDAEEVFTARLDGEAQQIAHFVEEIPLEIFLTVREAIALAGSAVRRSQVLVLALADHLNQAIARAREGILITYPIEWEVAQLYPVEYGLGRQTLELARRKLCPELPTEEATALAMHYVNSQFVSGDLSGTTAMTAVLRQALEAVRAALGPAATEDAMSTARFITHLRYLCVRLSDGKQLDGRVALPQVSRTDAVDHAVAAVQCLFESTSLGASPSSRGRRGTVKLTNAELAYLRLHIERLRETRV